MNPASIQDNHLQFGFSSGVPDPPLYRFKTSPLLNMYESRVNEVNQMPGSGVPVPSWDLFKIVVTALWGMVTLLLSAVCFLLWFYFSSMRDDVNTLRRELSDNATGIRRDFSDARVEFTKAVGNVEKEVATTNGKLDTTNAKLDTIASELQRTRSRR
jgi:hypothetical protein